jgi:hypothetical protein
MNMRTDPSSPFMDLFRYFWKEKIQHFSQNNKSTVKNIYLQDKVLKLVSPRYLFLIKLATNFHSLEDYSYYGKILGYFL